MIDHNGNQFNCEDYIPKDTPKKIKKVVKKIKTKIHTKIEIFDDDNFYELKRKINKFTKGKDVIEIKFYLDSTYKASRRACVSSVVYREVIK